MKQDLNKGITSISYNYLNLPAQMDINAAASEARTRYTYSVAGQKLRVHYKWNSNREITPLTGSNLQAIIAWQVSNTLRAEDTVIPALNKACSSRAIQNNHSIVFHSDRGIQYACNQFKDTLKKYKWIEQSMSGKGNCYDNAVAESFFKTLKAELIYQNAYKSKKQDYLSVFEYIEGFYNTNRRHSALGNLTIKEFNEQYKSKYKKVA